MNAAISLINNCTGAEDMILILLNFIIVTKRRALIPLYIDIESNGFCINIRYELNLFMLV